MNNLLNDLRYALRQLRKAPGFTLTAVITLALGIGISAAMFTVVDGVLLRQLPAPHPSQLVRLGEAGQLNEIGSSSLPNVKDWAAQNKSFQGMTWYTQSFFNLKQPDGSANFAENAQTSPKFFSVLQVRPLLGRTFLPRDANVAVLSYNVWNQYFARDPKILGKTVHLGAATYTVIGVMPRHFYFPVNDNGALVWTLLVTSPTMQRQNEFLSVIGRMRPGVTVDAAQAELTGIQGNIARRYASLALPKYVGVDDYLDVQVGSVRSGLLALQGAVLLVWLIACANVAGLLLTRLSARRREIAVRAALGASRQRIVWQFLTESLLLSFASGAIGLGIAEGCLVALHHAIATNLSRSSNVALNWQVVLVLIGLSILSAIIFGVAPALQAASANPQDALHQGTLGAGTGLRQVRLRNLLIVGELALSLVLLFAAGLLLRTLYALHDVDLGFNQHNLIDAQYFPGGGNFVLAEKPLPVVETTYMPLLERTRRLPGVESAALISHAPLSNNVHLGIGFTLIGSPEIKRDVSFNAVTPGAFRTLEIPLLRGRFFNDTDTKTTRAVCIVNQAFARTYFPGKSALDQRLDLNPNPSPTDKTIYGDIQIVGVVGDTSEGKIADAAKPMVFININQVAVDDSLYPILALAMELVIRTHQQPQTLLPAVHSVFAEVAPGLSISSIQTFQQKIDTQLGSQSLAARLLWLFAIAAVLISAAGLYGLLSYSVSQRTCEIGVRIALGAQREDILRVVLRQASRLVVAGLAIGLFCAFFLGRFVHSFLYGVNGHDGVTLFFVAVILAVVGLFAAYVPARRASRIEPTEALRTE